MTRQDGPTIRTKEDLFKLAVKSVRRCGGLSVFWGQVSRAKQNRTITMSLAEVKQFETTEANRIYRIARGKAAVSNRGVYEAVTWASGEIAINPLAGVDRLRTDNTPLANELPNYMSLIQPRPDKVVLLETTIAVHDLVTLQPLFKVVAVYRRRHGSANCQLMILGRDRHTKEPFALGVPNSFVGFPIDTALRWTMDIHKGDLVKEV